jgi:adenine-specific DNA-methyltransferase
MKKPQDHALRELILELLAANGGTLGNQNLMRQVVQAAGERDIATSESDVRDSCDALVQEGRLIRGKGRSGSLSIALSNTDADDESFDLAAQELPADAGVARKPRGAKSGRAIIRTTGGPEVISYRHPDKRRNNPEVGMVTPDTDPQTPKTTWAYDPHIDPTLQFDVGRAQIEKLIDDSLASGDQDQMRAALEQLKRQAEPYLNWAGKAERTSFEVDTVSLHVHERIDPMSILSAVRKAMKTAKKGEFTGQMGLFQAPFENLPLRDAIDFYKHEKGWSNRLIAGDSLLVMNSLLQKEGMAGQVQMVYIDPPYGIKYGSNFQPFVNKRDVKDRRDEDLTQEPEMIKAFRDTWELGVHSYLTYLRDRLLSAKDLLHESGSVFVQISDENLHLVRNLLDDVFGADNFICQISFQTTASTNSPQARTLSLSRVFDYVLWYSKDRDKLKYRQVFLGKETGGSFEFSFSWVLESNGSLRRATPPDYVDGSQATLVSLSDLTGQNDNQIYAIKAFGEEFQNKKRGWRTTEEGIARLLKANRVVNRGGQLRYKNFLKDFPVTPINNNWSDTGAAAFVADKIYVVETNIKVVERCLHMVTDPGDLVLDPTCGSGTTAFVAEKWGRRWITADTSRVAVALAKQRLMTASYDYYELKYPHEGLKGGFIYQTVPHVTLKSIANNTEIDEIYERLHPAIERALTDLNRSVGLSALKEWEVPFDFPESWKAGARSAFDAFHAARLTMQRKMDESIAAHADQEILYDKPAFSRDKLRITGPFTVEAVPFPSVLALDQAEQPKEADLTIARSGESARQHTWRDELMKTGIRGKGGQMIRFAELETLPELRYLHCSGTVADTGERVVVSFGPEHAALEQRQVEMAMREAGELFPRPKMIVFCAFTFDPEAAKDIDQTKGIVALKAQMNTDLLTDDLKKARSNNQSFWLMGQPDVELRKLKSGEYEIEVHGFDYFDTVKGELVSGGKGKIAAWMLDTDYDERSLFPRQVFFPMAGAKDGWNKLKKDIKAELDEGRLDQFHGTVSLHFAAGDNRKVAVKIVDDRGIESLKVIPLD